MTSVTTSFRVVQNRIPWKNESNGVLRNKYFSTLHLGLDVRFLFALLGRLLVFFNCLFSSVCLFIFLGGRGYERFVYLYALRLLGHLI